MSNLFYDQENISYQYTEDDLIEQYFKDEEDSTEPPFSMESEESFYMSNVNFNNHRQQKSKEETVLLKQVNKCMRDLDMRNNKDIFDISIIDPKSKKIRREVAKNRVQIKKSIGHVQQQPIEEVKTHMFIPDCISNAEDFEEKSAKKLKQMIRNRISAQNSRDRKKAYVANLEKTKQMLQLENSQLKMQIVELTQNNKNLQEENDKLRAKFQTESHKHTNFGFKGPSRLNCMNLAHLARNSVNDPAIQSLFESSPKSFFNYTLTFATLLSLLFILNINGNIEKPELKTSKLYNPDGTLSNLLADLQSFSQKEDIFNKKIDKLDSKIYCEPVVQSINHLQKYLNEDIIQGFFQKQKVDSENIITHALNNSNNNVELDKTSRANSEQKPLIENDLMKQIIQNKNELFSQQASVSNYGVDEKGSNNQRNNNYMRMFCPKTLELLYLNSGINFNEICNKNTLSASMCDNAQSTSKKRYSNHNQKISIANLLNRYQLKAEDIPNKLLKQLKLYKNAYE